jgi:hypothetical protein
VISTSAWKLVVWNPGSRLLFLRIQSRDRKLESRDWESQF